jgi:hypothetical protein
MQEAKQHSNSVHDWWPGKRPNEGRNSRAGKEDCMIGASELPMGLGQVYRENQYVTDVSYRFDVREEAGELIRIGGYIQIVGGMKEPFGYGVELTLRLDDGREIEIVIKTLDFNSGEYLFAAKSAEE